MGNSQEQEKYNNLWINEWGDIQTHGPLHKHLRRAIIRHLKNLSFNSVLDVGCGSGQSLNIIKKELGINRLVGIDISDQAISVAKNNYSGINFECKNLENLKIDDKYDLVMSIHVVEHISNDVEVIHLMKNLSNKYVYISTLGGKMRPSEVTIGHVRNYSPDELRRKIESAGLKIILFEKWGFPFYSPIYRSLIEYFPQKITYGKMSRVKRFISGVIDFLYFFNSSKYGDIYNILAEVDDK